MSNIYCVFFDYTFIFYEGMRRKKTTSLFINKKEVTFIRRKNWVQI